MTLKSRLGVTQGNDLLFGNGTIRKLVYGFIIIFAFHSNSSSNLRHFGYRPLTGLSNHCPSVLWRLGPLTHKIVLRMTYNQVESSSILIQHVMHTVTILNTSKQGLSISRSDVLELTAQKLAWPVIYCCCFWTITKNISFLRVPVYTVHQRHLRWCAI